MEQPETLTHAERETLLMSCGDPECSACTASAKAVRIIDSYVGQADTQRVPKEDVSLRPVAG